ncbi:MAG: L-threonylcarbamoyladenylate synthase [Planctomycetota bacterium]
MKIVPANEANVAEAGARVRRGELVSLPTETVYGLGADAFNGEAVAKIFEAKARPRFNPLIVHVSDDRQAFVIAEAGERARKLADAFWPGPFTMVLPRNEASGLSELVTAGLDSVAVRVPDHPVAQAILLAAKRPIAAPSANKSGRISPTRAEHVASDLGDELATIIDGGPAAHGLESTIVSLASNPAVLLRPGAVTREQIESVLGESLSMPDATAISNADTAPIAPGQLASHYAPNATVRLEATDVRPGEALLSFGATTPATSGPTINLSPSANLREAAAKLFESLRELDRANVDQIAVMPIPRTSLGLAINDRLKRAAAPR